MIDFASIDWSNAALTYFGGFLVAGVVATIWCLKPLIKHFRGQPHDKIE